jgi:hypothetical protein
MTWGDGTRRGGGWLRRAVEPTAMSQSPETVILTLGPAQKITLDLGKGSVNARKVSDNKIQLKFRTKDFEAEYFHYTGDLFFIYKSGHLMKLTCQTRENVGLGRSGAGEMVHKPTPRTAATEPKRWGDKTRSIVLT